MEQINLNLIPGGVSPVCHASQYDTGRTIRFNLFEGDQVFAFASGDTAELQIRKPDNTVYNEALTVTASNTYVEIETAEQMTACAGNNVCQIEIKNLTQTIGTANFIMEVEADPMSDGIESDSVIRDLQAQVDAAVDVKMGTIENELEDIRNGANGKTYPSAGDAVRGQVTQLNTAVLDLMTSQDINYAANIFGKFVNSSGTLTNNGLLRASDYITIPELSEYVKIGNIIQVTNNTYKLNPAVVFFDENKTLISAYNTAENYAVTKIPVNAKYLRFNQANTSNTNVLNTSIIGCWFISGAVNKTLGIVGAYTGAFTAQQQKQTGVYMKANTTYLIKFYAPRTKTINVFGEGNSGAYKRVQAFQNEVYFTNDAQVRQLRIYNPEAQLDPIDLKVFEVDAPESKCEQVPRRYVVNKNIAVSADYTSLTACLFALKDDDAPKIIEVWEGDYDLFAEYTALWNEGLLPIYTGSSPSTDYFNYCVWVPKNTHIIGKGLVKLTWAPDPSVDSITPNQCKCISPLNVAGTATIENVEVYCKNGRYCIHNDALGKTEYFGAIQKYINVKCYKFANDVEPGSGDAYGLSQTIGFGIDRAMHHVYQNCFFKNETNGRAFYGHSRTGVISNEYQNPDITVDNCVMITPDTAPYCVKFGNSSSAGNVHIRTMFNNCYFSGKVGSILETGAGNCINGFEIQFNNCGNVSVEITDPDNAYPPTAYNTNMTIV